MPHQAHRAAGRPFQKHTAIPVRTVERPRQDVGIAAGYRGTLAVGWRFGLWEGLLVEWLQLLRSPIRSPSRGDRLVDPAPCQRLLIAGLTVTIESVYDGGGAGPV